MKRLLTVSMCWLFAGIVLAGEPSTNRPSSWAKPVRLDGVPNLHQVSTNLYRSAQPTAQGMQNLKQMGVASVLSLRSFHSDRDEIGKTELAYEHIRMKAWHPEREDVIRFLQLATDPHRNFSHAWGGKIILSGNPSHDAKRYQERDVERVIREVTK